VRFHPPSIAALDIYFPSCHKIVQNAVSCCPIHGDEVNAEAGIRRFLEGPTDHGICSYPLVDAGYEVGCDEHKFSVAHVAHDALFWTTVVILGTFEVELLLLVYLLGPEKFVHHCMYVLDLIIVTVSLVFELVLYFIGQESAAALLPEFLIIFRVWRFVRIGHGLVASAHEVEHEKMHVAFEHVDKLEGLLRDNGVKVPERPKKLRQEEDEYSIEPRANSKKDEADESPFDEFLYTVI
jgi:hypothetical protein